MFNYDWNLSDGYPAKGITPNNLKVFGCFVCGGGSTMGYKLAGYNHLGGVEIDPKIAKMYRTNHNPLYFYNEDIRIFNDRTDLPDELYQLDVLDGSPPCTTFSMAGDREKTWGKSKKFAEGQTEQVLDDLVFVYCNTINKLKPKVALLENVAGIVKGNAIWYSKQIIKLLNGYGYDVQVFRLYAATMGVPQIRNRVFFIVRRKDLALPKLTLNFDYKPIPFSQIMDRNDTVRNITDELYEIWKHRLPKDAAMDGATERVTGKRSAWDVKLVKYNNAVPTILTSHGHVLYDIPRLLNKNELLKAASFPCDYDFCGYPPLFACGMSVPPVMTAHLSYQIAVQLFNK